MLVPVAICSLFTYIITVLFVSLCILYQFQSVCTNSLLSVPIVFGSVVPMLVPSLNIICILLGWASSTSFSFSNLAQKHTVNSLLYVYGISPTLYRYVSFLNVVATYPFYC